MRKQILRFAHSRSNEEWINHQRILTDYFKRKQEQLEIEPVEFLNNKEWVQYEQERTYHSLFCNATQAIPKAINNVVKVWMEKELNFAIPWSETIIQAGEDCNNNIISEWGYKLMNGINEHEEKENSIPLQNLIGEIVQKNFVQDDTEKSFLFLLKGNAFSEGHNDKAIECYQKAIELKPDYATAFSNMGIAFSDKGDKDKALECYQKAIELKPDYADAFNNMGTAFSYKGDKDKAIEYYQKAIELKPDDATAFDNMGIAFSDKGDNDKAIECYQKAIELRPDYATAFSNMGIAFSDKGDKEKAIECYQKAIKLKPDYATAFNNMGIAFSDKGDKDKAIECYQKAIELKPDYADALMSLGFLYLTIGNLNQAEEALKLSVLFGSNAFGNINLGHVYLAKDKEAEAIKYYQKSLQAFNNKEEFWQGMKDDFKYLKQYGISLEYYIVIQNKISA